MDPHAARELALDLMRRHGLAEWGFGFDRAKRRFGACRWRERRITLSRTLAFLNPEAQVRDTLLHEIAHALTPGEGHGPRWRAKCVELGATPTRCYTDDEVVSPPRRAARFTLACPRCGWRVDRRRRTRERLVCRGCRGPVVLTDKFLNDEPRP